MENIEELKNKLIQYEEREKKLSALVEELTDFVENASVPLHWVDKEGRILWANQAELDTLGYKKEEYIGFHIRDFYADQDAINDVLTRLGNDETLDNYLAKLKCKDGTIKHMLINSNVLRKDGEFIHTRCFTRDVTKFILEERRKEELLTKLEQSESRLKMAIEATKLGTWDYNPISNKLYWSEECKKIYRLPADAVVDFELFIDHIYPEDRFLVQQEIQQCMKKSSNGIYDITFRILRFDDTVSWVKAQGKVYFNIEEQPKRFFGTLLDITEIKQAEEKSAKLAAIVESTDDAIISKTLEGIITSWNNSAERTFGYSEEEMLGESILKLIPEDRAEEEPLILARLKNGERVEHFETKRLTKDKRLLDVSLTISPVKDNQGKIIGLSKIARDISEKKQEEIRKNDFVAMVSHELKTPLTSLLSYVQLLLAKAKKSGDSFGINALTRAENQAKKMTSMIQAFLNLARFEEAKIQINKERFEVHPMLEEIVSDTLFINSDHLIQYKPCEGIYAFADQDKIGQVMANLLSNAIKYSAKGSTITIGCRKVDNKVEFFVSDEGIGISLMDQEKLFDRFYRVNNNEKLKNVSGFGIGLYLVSEILRYHNSKIEVKSKEGVGSTFFFDLESQ